MSYAKYYRNWMYELRLTSSINSSGKKKKKGKRKIKKESNEYRSYTSLMISLADIYL